MEKRLFTAVIVSIGILALWMWAAPLLFPELAKKPQQPVKRTTATTTTTAKTATMTTTSQAASPKPAAPVAINTAPTNETKLAMPAIETPDYVARFSNRGAELVSFQLKRYTTNDGHLVELVKAREPSRTDYPFAIESNNTALAQQLNAALWSVADRVENNRRVVEFRYANGGIAAVKTFKFLPGEYLFTFDVTLSPAIPYRVVVGPGIRTLDPDERDSQIVITGNGVVQRDGKLDALRREKADKFNVFGAVDFVGIEDNYFLSVLRPERASGAVIRGADFPTGTKGEKRRDLYAGLNAMSDGSVAGTAFFGPKQATLLDRYGLDKTLQFGMFGIIARVFLLALFWINTYTHNFGWAIIVLTILIKLALYPLQHKWMLSMKKIQKAQPKMEAIKARYKKARTDAEQRQKMNQEMMKLYQQEGINPAGGCLPMLIQFPIFLGFYNLLAHSIELRHAPWIFWIHDLSAKDPYYVLPILMGAAMFVQQKITPATADPAQRRMFYFLPIVFTWIFKEFATGLVLYWLVQNLLTIVQQLIMNKWSDGPPPATA
jgi:YidC/Oxa1 family membrane protein insertase